MCVKLDTELHTENRWTSKKEHLLLKSWQWALAEPDSFYILCSFVYLFPYSFGIFMDPTSMEDFLQTVGCSCYHIIGERYSLSSITRNKKWKINKRQLFHMWKNDVLQLGLQRIALGLDLVTISHRTLYLLRWLLNNSAIYQSCLFKCGDNLYVFFSITWIGLPKNYTNAALQASYCIIIWGKILLTAESPIITHRLGPKSEICMHLKPADCLRSKIHRHTSALL